MWIERDFNALVAAKSALPIKVLKGPRQVGKTTVLERLGSYTPVYLDDATTRLQAERDPRLFLDNLPRAVILDEAPLAPALFPELKRRVDAQRHDRTAEPAVDVWITGSNQTLLNRHVRESLAGRASYFDLNTLSIHELGDRYSLSDLLMKGGWPELYVSPHLTPVRYLNDLAATFIEKDIVSAAGIEKKAAFTKVLHLLAGRVGQLCNASDIATNSSVEVTTVQSWCALLEENGILRKLPPFFSNLNQRLIKSPKYYFEDVALATRLQGWSEPQPLLVSPAVGSLIENLAISEVVRFFANRFDLPTLYFIRSKDGVEIDLLISLPNQRYVAAEIKATPTDFSEKQMAVLNSLNLDVIDRWIISPTPAQPFRLARVVALPDIWQQLATVY